MKIENVEKKENVVLHRDEVSAQVIFNEATPSRSDIIKALASATKAKEDLVIVRRLQGNYGGGSATLVAHVYKDRASLENVEREYMRTRNTVKEEEKPADPENAEEKPAEKTEEAAEEKPAEAPAEDSKEKTKEAAEEPEDSSEKKMEESPEQTEADSKTKEGE